MPHVSPLLENGMWNRFKICDIGFFVVVVVVVVVVCFCAGDGAGSSLFFIFIKTE